MEEINIIIIDDGAFLETCCSYFLDSIIKVRATATNVSSAIKAIENHRNDIQLIILDVDLGNGHFGMEVVKYIKSNNIPIKILILSGLVHEAAFVLPFKGLVEGILHKNEEKTLIKRAVQGIAVGRTGFYSPECIDILLNRDFRNFYTLSEEEIETLHRLSKGFTNSVRLAGYVVMSHLALQSETMLQDIKRARYLLPEDVPANKRSEKSVYDILFKDFSTIAANIIHTKYWSILSSVRKQVLLTDGRTGFITVSALELSLEEKLSLILKRQEGRFRRDILPRIFRELEVESTIEALIWTQEWELSKTYELASI
ncbi:MAG: response regulator transcription factor [Bacteroidetes Order II. Incertae sedis bacterium]|nr:response regulator transcription factor [Bacteroidetes Order II. bacterium]